MSALLPADMDECSTTYILYSKCYAHSTCRYPTPEWTPALANDWMEGQTVNIAVFLTCTLLEFGLRHNSLRPKPKWGFIDKVNNNIESDSCSPFR